MKLKEGKERILVIPDLHAPFTHVDAYAFLRALKDKYKPTQVVCLGDELDAHALSFHISDPDGYSAGHEHARAIEMLQPLYKMFPKVKVCTSNHTARPFRRAFDCGIPKAFLKSYKEFMEAPAGWDWKDEHEVDGIIFEHGEGFSGQNGAIKAALSNMQSTVIGHLHSFAGVNFVANKRHLIFGMNAGCLLDSSAYAFAYSKKHKNKPIVGAGIVLKGVPFFVPMILDKGGRWGAKI